MIEREQVEQSTRKIRDYQVYLIAFPPTGHLYSIRVLPWISSLSSAGRNGMPERAEAEWDPVEGDRWGRGHWRYFVGAILKKDEIQKYEGKLDLNGMMRTVR